jgi:hypothetical protein
MPADLPGLFRNASYAMSNVIDHIFALPAPFNMVVVIVAIVFTGITIGGIAEQIRKYACQKRELDFKREMVDRGMSAEEIERLVKARSASQRDEST